ncbi:putative P4 family phage/plasmid primase [Methylorubrum extorquens DM4]|uniref:P4 family phage/plasmid primase n=1 Tax=Methylorubrum extorquens (strain DSM 6343 / CIP 106787 / DM4) TaxID=661410 RepID=C7CJL4_METED|nr:putative P4 family phage/plasmid primase [Methylorubrum extorquens DM4]
MKSRLGKAPGRSDCVCFDVINTHQEIRLNTITPLTYIECGYDITVLKPRTKEPKLKNWTGITLEIEDIEAHGTFPEHYNIGIKLGSASDGIVDVDLDCDAAVSLGAKLLNTETRVFGRDDNPASHYMYRVFDPHSTVKFKHPISRKMIVELRGNGSQTVLPGSIYKDGTDIRFEDYSLPEPLNIDWETLKRQCGLIAAGTVFSQFWIEGSRHLLALALGGWAAHKQIDQKTFTQLIEAVAVYASDDDVADRIDCIRASYAKFEAGGKTAWKDDLNECIADGRIMNAVADWLMVGREPEQEAVLKQSKRPLSATSDLQSGKDFCAYVGDSLIFCDDQEQFYHRQNDVYEPVTLAHVKETVMDYVGSLDVDRTNFEEMRKLKAAQSVGRINAIVDVSRSILRISSSKFDTDPFLAGCKNGVLDLRTGELVEPDCIVTRRLGTNYDSDAWCHLFLTFMHQVFEGDQEKIAFVRRAVGYTLTGSTAGQCMFLVIGTGANGKSTFLKVIQALMGEYGGSIPSHSMMASKFGNDKTDDIASLDGRRFVSASEGEMGQKLAVAKVKLMTGGDTIACRPLYGKYFDMKPEFKIWFGTNDLPVIAGGDEAIWRRLYVIDFPVSFTEAQRDGGLFDRLKLELPGILNWALQGVRELGGMKSNFLNPPASVRNETNRYRSDSDTVASFIEAGCDRVEGAVVMMNVLHETYTRWCNTSGVEPLSSGLFGKELNRLGFQVKRKKEGNGRLGIKLKQ